MLRKLKNAARKVLKPNPTKALHNAYFARYAKHGFREADLKTFSQFEASMTKMYHGVEKGLSYENYRPGFGKDAILKLISVMQNFAEKFDTDAFCYQTSLACLQEYVRKNNEHGFSDADMEQKIASLPGNANAVGGTISFVPKTKEELKTLDFEAFIKDRHTIRHFSGEPVAIEDIKEAIKLAQHTPSACNRQGWKTRIVADKKVLKTILENQNGNRGFGQEIDKMLVVTCDLNAFAYGREVYQGYMDGGMYALNILYALHYMHIGSVPLSASLSAVQDKNVRNVLGMKDSECLVMFIGVGSYPESCLTTRSERRSAEIEVI